MNENLPRILIVEDEKPMARALELKLKSSGFDPSVAFDGEDALARLQTERFSLVILDLMMPRKDGFAVLTELRSRNDRTPVIVASNLSQEEDMARAHELGAVGYFVKSNTPIASLVETIRSALHEPEH